VITAKQILRAKAQEYGVPFEDILVGRRYKAATRARQEAVNEINHLFPRMSTTWIARQVGMKNHTSVLYALRKPYLKTVQKQTPCWIKWPTRAPLSPIRNDNGDEFIQALVKESSA
jgi:hypothetical protein